MPAGPSPPICAELWKTHRTRPWLFPHPGSVDRPRPLSRRALQLAFVAARERSGLTKHPVSHTLRHCYGTHLLESGVNLRLLQAESGPSFSQHHGADTHLTAPALASLRDPLNALMRGP